MSRARHDGRPVLRCVPPTSPRTSPIGPSLPAVSWSRFWSPSASCYSSRCSASAAGSSSRPAHPARPPPLRRCRTRPCRRPPLPRPPLSPRPRRRPCSRLPNVRGLDYETAAAELTKLGFIPVRREEINGEVPAGKVIGTDPPQGTPVLTGTRINIDRVAGTSDSIVSCGIPEPDRGANLGGHRPARHRQASPQGRFNDGVSRTAA